MTEEPGVTDSGVGQLESQLAGVARVLLSAGTVDETLQRIVSLAVASIDGCDESALCRVPGSGPRLATSTLVADLDELQSALREGPCIDTLSGVDSVYVDDLSADGRWPKFAPMAVGLGVHSALAYRLFSGSRTLGALQLYAGRPGAFDLLERTQGLIFASVAGMAISVAEDHATQLDRATNLETALRSREIVGQAQGILMERERVTADQAFDQLRKSSQHLNIKLRDIAQELVDTGNLRGSEVQESD